MKKRNLLCLVLIAASIAAFFGYQAFDRIRTDTKAPTISVGEDIPLVSVYDPDSALLTGVTATDNRDGDVTGSMVVEKTTLMNKDGTTKVFLAAFDSAGNVAKSERLVQYSDYKSPVLSLSAPLAFVQYYSFELLDYVHAEDLLDGDISHRVRATSLDESSISDLGTHEVLFSVTNSLGDTVELVLPVESYLSGQHNSQLTLTDYLIYLPRGSVFNARAYLDEFTAGTRTISLSAGLPEDLTLEVEGTVNTQKAGTYAVNYTVSNTYFSGYSRLIVVVEG